MRVLLDPTGDRRAILLVGEGLIGSAIADGLRRPRTWDESLLGLRWTDRAGLLRDLEQVRDRVRSLDDLAEVHLVWAAGRAGFGADETECEAERETFAAVTGAIREGLGDAGRRRIGAHLISSAGGLFEGRSIRSRVAPPRPLRPYGRLKAWQEEHLERLFADCTVRVYRPSSVYGLPAPGHRRGLVTTMVANAIEHRVTHIFGDLFTLRDYVHAADVGTFVARCVLDPSARGVARHLLAVARPHSIGSIRRIVERFLNRRVYVTLRPVAMESRPMSFSPRCLPESGWRPRSLEEGVAGLVRALRGGSPCTA